MSKLRVKANLQGTVRSFELDRDQVSFNNVRQKVSSKFGINGFTITYNGYPVGDDAQLQSAIYDAEKSRATNLKLIVNSGSAPPSYSQPAAQQTHTQPTYSQPPSQPAAQQTHTQPTHSQPTHTAAPLKKTATTATRAEGNELLSFHIPAANTNNDKVKIEHSQGDDHFVFTPVASKYATDVQVVIDGSKLVYNNTYTFLDGNVQKTMTLTQNFTLPFAPTSNLIKIDGNVLKVFYP